MEQKSPLPPVSEQAFAAEVPPAAVPSASPFRDQPAPTDPDPDDHGADPAPTSPDSLSRFASLAAEMEAEDDALIYARPDLPPFSAVLLRARHDGWTPRRQVEVILGMAETGCVKSACAMVGMSRQSLSRLLNRPDAISFRLAWDAAVDMAMRQGEASAVHRMINGVTRPVFYKGKKVGEKTYHDERLTMFLLSRRYPERYGRRAEEPAPTAHPEDRSTALTIAFHKLAEDAGIGDHERIDRMEQRRTEIEREMEAKEGVAAILARLRTLEAKVTAEADAAARTRDELRVRRDAREGER